MKNIRFLAFAALFATLVSCEVGYGDIDPVDKDELIDYTEILFANNVMLPVEMVDFAMEFDAYLSMPEEKKQESVRFYGNIRKSGEDVFSFSDSEVTCIVDTGGMSVWEDGARWKYLSFTSDTYAVGFGRKGWQAWIMDDVLMTFEKDDSGNALLLATVDMNGSEVSLALETVDEGLCTWNLFAEGTDVGKSGLKAEFCTGGIHVSERCMEDMYLKEKIFEGIFEVDIFKGTEKVDWCRMLMNPGYRTEYETSR